MEGSSEKKSNSAGATSLLQFSIFDSAAATTDSDCLIVGLYADGTMPPATAAVNQAARGYLKHLFSRGDLSGKSESAQLLLQIEGVSAPRVLVVGLGEKNRLDERTYQNVLRTAIHALRRTGTAHASSFLTELPVGPNATWRLRTAALWSGQASYQFSPLLKTTKKPAKLRKLDFAGQANKEGQAALAQAHAILTGMARARNLGNLPPNVCTPTYLAEQARELARRHNLKVTVLGRAEMERLGMGSLLAVARGAEEPPRLITLEYTGAAAKDQPIVLVGKGVTFDSGGISIKPSDGMDEMKYDMSGAASVLGTLEACALMKLPLNVVAVMPATENMPDGRATRPGDVVTSMSGLTVEVINTDAEGRMILCDALTYAKRFSPDCVVDVATLTGACVVALGKVASGLFTNHEGLGKELLDASRISLDHAWPLPLWEHYQSLIDSNFADMANSGGRYGGAISGACFLSRYTKDYRWAHLDIAGTAWVSGQDKNSTGRPVPLLSYFLLSRAGYL